MNNKIKLLLIIGFFTNNLAFSSSYDINGYQSHLHNTSVDIEDEYHPLLHAIEVYKMPDNDRKEALLLIQERQQEGLKWVGASPSKIAPLWNAEGYIIQYEVQVLSALGGSQGEIYINASSAFHSLYKESEAQAYLYFHYKLVLLT
ncbi:hypothetical protein [Pseudoalteromonas luteoviolacea]|uniref:Uncharacterized protein n=1 Tax=Pseudoalteromonas luteoviolacea H33 TaxID=1365251 RepID=A0A167E491_9GAMM|nr:hypothetical protein [Pseudoalteromonas luteoviolacea]KZN50023.1 hypothetical protein N476_16890 [Pseudoalteromonas luteoviolacea H33]KZN76403.1 hypothetical protein N477_16995 [Pseudoalteromonas luteoviolacea H33-S]